MLYDKITDLIGNTPLLKIDAAVHKLKNIDLYAKLEFYNPFGSVKDRVAWAILKDDIDKIVNEKRTVIEASSGNTAKALQLICATYGVPFKTLTNRLRVHETKGVLQLAGAEIEELPGLSECPDPTIADGVFSTVEKMVAADPDKYYYPSQYVNEKNVKTHFETTGKEIADDIGPVDFLYGGLGTTGSTRGTGMYLKTVNSELSVYGIVSSDRDFIPGIRNIEEMWEVGLFEKDFYEDMLVVDSKEAIDATLELIKQSGILAGPTSGACYAGALNHLKKIDAGLTKRKKAVFIVCDRVEWYISYFQKRRPDLFGIKEQGASIETLSEAEISKTPSIRNSEAEEWIQKNNPLILDVRTNMAYKIGHIPGAINLPLAILEQLIDRNLPFPKEQKIFVTCTFGEQSKMAATLLNQKGYNSYNLEDGLSDWMQEEKPLEKIT